MDPDFSDAFPIENGVIPWLRWFARGFFSVELPAFCEDICRPTDSPSMVLMDVSRPNSGFNGYS